MNTIIVLVDVIRDTIRLVRIILVFVGTVAFLAEAAAAQTCPATVDGYSLVRSTYSGWTVNNLSCKPRDEGGTMCWIVCGYSNSITRDGFYTQAMWYTHAPPSKPYYSEMCSSSPPSNTIANTVKQIKSFWGDVAGEAETQAARKVAQHLFGIGELQAVACPPPPVVRVDRPGPIPPECSPGSPVKPRGRVKMPQGKVEIYSYAFDKWKGPITSEFPVFPCDWVRTGPQSSSTVFIYTPSGAEDRIDMSSDTILEIPGLLDIERLPAEIPQESLVTDLIKGTIRWITPETPGERMRREQVERIRESQVFNVRTPTITVGTRGTDFVLRHDQDTKSDFILLNSGKLDIGVAGKNVALSAGQQMFVVNGVASPVQELKPDIWNAVIGQRTIAGPGIFTGASSGGPLNRPAGGDRFVVLYKGKSYSTIYEQTVWEGKPLEMYFFEIIGPDGKHAEQDGAKLWGRFSRYPAVDEKSGIPVRWMFHVWAFREGRWVYELIEGQPYQVVK